jgi:FkbM family methyltransferase
MFQTTKSQRRKIKHAVDTRDFKYLIKSIIFHTRFSKHFELKRFGYKMRVFYTPFAFWLWTEGRQRSDENFYSRFLREGDTVVDAGANIGLCTLLSGVIVGTAGQVHAFEPHPKTFRHLNKNVGINKLNNVTTHNKGLGNKDECVNFTDEYVSDINHIDSKGKKKIFVTTLDKQLPEIKEITLLKIDVEGYELFTLLGARKTLLATRVVYFENNTRTFARYGYSFKEIFDLLSDHGMCVYKENEGSLEKISRDYVCLSNYENLLGMRQKDIHFLEKRLKADFNKT